MASPTAPLTTRLSEVADTVRWAPAPRWGSSAAEHGKYVGYLGGSMLAWTLIGVLSAAAFGWVLSL